MQCSAKLQFCGSLHEKIIKLKHLHSCIFGLIQLKFGIALFTGSSEVHLHALAACSIADIGIDFGGQPGHVPHPIN